MAPESDKPISQKPDPLGTDPATLKASGASDAGQSKAEDAVEDEVADIVSSKDEDRSFSPAKDADSQPDEANKHVDKQLDHGLKETFPASDPVSINPGAD